MTQRRATPPAPTLSDSASQTLGRLTTPGEGGWTVTRTATAGRGGTDIHRSLSGSIAARHALSVMPGQPPMVEESRSGLRTRESAGYHQCTTIGLIRGFQDGGLRSYSIHPLAQARGPLERFLWICADCDTEVDFGQRREHMRDEHGITYTILEPVCDCGEMPCKRARELMAADG